MSAYNCPENIQSNDVFLPQSVQQNIPEESEVIHQQASDTTVVSNYSPPPDIEPLSLAKQSHLTDCKLV
jgi:hypothetical protein